MPPKGGSHGTRIVSELGHFDFEHAAVAGKDVLFRDSVHFFEVQFFERFDQSSAQDDNFGAKHVDQVDDGVAHGLGCLADNIFDRFVSISNRSGQDFAANLGNVGPDRSQKIGGFASIREFSAFRCDGETTRFAFKGSRHIPISMHEERLPRRICPS